MKTHNAAQRDCVWAYRDVHRLNISLIIACARNEEVMQTVCVCLCVRCLCPIECYLFLVVAVQWAPRRSIATSLSYHLLRCLLFLLLLLHRFVSFCSTRIASTKKKIKRIYIYWNELSTHSNIFISSQPNWPETAPFFLNTSWKDREKLTKKIFHFCPDNFVACVRQMETRNINRRRRRWERDREKRNITHKWKKCSCNDLKSRSIYIYIYECVYVHDIYLYIRLKIEEKQKSWMSTEPQCKQHLAAVAARRE